MNKKITDVLSYFGALGWVLAFFLGDKEGAKFHMNQALVFVIVDALIGLVDWIPVVGWVLAVIILVFRIMGIVYACQGQDKEVPLFGTIKILN